MITDHDFGLQCENQVPIITLDFCRTVFVLKITILADVLPEGFICPGEMDGIRRMAQYICLFHVPHYPKARLSAAAPRLDLELYQHMCQYALIDPEVSEQVKNSIFRQQWYLTEELVVLSLSDTKLSNDIRASIANTLLQTQNLLPIHRPNQFSGMIFWKV